MEIISFIENGYRRRGERANCKVCNKEFTRRINPQGGKKKECCSVKCRGVSERDRIQTSCYNCKRIFFRHPSDFKSKHGFQFCGRKCKELAQSLDGICKEIRPVHYGTGLKEYRNKVKKQIKEGCITCGIKNEFLLQVHHKDGNRENNDLSNLEVVCHNCHTIRHLKLIDGKWKFDYKVLTPRNMIETICKLLGP